MYVAQPLPVMSPAVNCKPVVSGVAHDMLLKVSQPLNVPSRSLNVEHRSMIGAPSLAVTLTYIFSCGYVNPDGASICSWYEPAVRCSRNLPSVFVGAPSPTPLNP